MKAAGNEPAAFCLAVEDVAAVDAQGQLGPRFGLLKARGRKGRPLPVSTR